MKKDDNDLILTTRTIINEATGNEESEVVDGDDLLDAIENAVPVDVTPMAEILKGGFKWFDTKDDTESD